MGFNMVNFRGIKNDILTYRCLQRDMYMDFIRLLLIFSTLFSAQSLAVFSDNACRLGCSAFEDIKNAITITETIDKFNDIKFSISFPKSIKEFDNIYLDAYKKKVVRISEAGHQHIQINKVLTTNLESTITGNFVKSSFTIKKEQLDLINFTVYFFNRRNTYMSDVPYCRYDIKK